MTDDSELTDSQDMALIKLASLFSFPIANCDRVKLEFDPCRDNDLPNAHVCDALRFRWFIEYCSRYVSESVLCKLLRNGFVESLLLAKMICDLVLSSGSSISVSDNERFRKFVGPHWTKLFSKAFDSDESMHFVLKLKIDCKYSLPSIFGFSSVVTWNALAIFVLQSYKDFSFSTVKIVSLQNGIDWSTWSGAVVSIGLSCSVIEAEPFRNGFVHERCPFVIFATASDKLMGVIVPAGLDICRLATGRGMIVFSGTNASQLSAQRW